MEIQKKQKPKSRREEKTKHSCGKETNNFASQDEAISHHTHSCGDSDVSEEILDENNQVKKKFIKMDQFQIKRKLGRFLLNPFFEDKFSYGELKQAAQVLQQEQHLLSKLRKANQSRCKAHNIFSQVDNIKLNNHKEKSKE